MTYTPPRDGIETLAQNLVDSQHALTLAVVDINYELVATRCQTRNEDRNALLDVSNSQTAHIRELEDACRAALAWYGPDGDHIHEPVRGQLRRALGLTEEMEDGYQRGTHSLAADTEDD